MNTTLKVWLEGVVVLSGVAVCATGCGRRGAEPAAAATQPGSAAVGWKLDLPGEKLRGGRVKTAPPGQEDALISGLATATHAWGKACAAEVDAAVAERPRVTVTVTLGVGGDGAILNARLTGTATAADKCFVTAANRSAGQRLRMTGDPAPPLQAWVALDFARAP